MATLLGPRLLSRRRLGKVAGTALAAVGLGFERRRVSAAATPNRRRIYVLNPEWGAGRRTCPASPAATHRRGGGDCHACKACHRHAANKRFATAKAASRGRAHRGCRCRVEVRFVTDREYARMFGEPGTAGARIVYDARW